ncbi:MAG: hypothetical protein LBK13_06790 [Spirochaetales bacterium]|nr:hypothetical protein [Spirochaetales bacterium]
MKSIFFKTPVFFKTFVFLKTLVLCLAGIHVFPDRLCAQYLAGENPVAVQVSSSAVLHGYLTNRLFARYDGYRLIAVSAKDFADSEKDYTAAGFDSPWLTAGTVNTEGLFREIFSPLGYSAGSPVFTETSRLSLNTTPQRSTRTGVWLKTPGDYAALGAYTDAQDISHSAATLNFFRGKRGPLLSGLLMLSQPPSRLELDDWFPEKPLFPGGTLYHAAFRGQIPFDSYSGGITRAGVSSALCFGERTRPAAYYTLFASHTDKTLDIRLLYGHADTQYTTPEGRYPSYLVNRSATLKLFPRGTVRPYIGVSRHLYQVYKPTAEHRPERLLVSGGTEYRTKRLTLKISGSEKTETDAAARHTRQESLAASFLYRTGRLSLGAEYASGWEEAVMRNRRFSMRAGYSPKGWDFAARTKAEWKPDLRLSGKLSAALDKPRLQAGIAAELTKALGPRPSALEALRENPWNYLALSVFFQYKTEF